MYAFVDRPVKDLDQTGRLLVWAMRSWVQSIGARQCPGHLLAPVFAGLTILAGLQPFMQMMALFNRHALENLQFCASNCDHVSEHEALILSLLYSTRARSPKTATGSLPLLVEDDAVGPVLDALVRLGAALDAAGMHPKRLPSGTPPQPDSPR